MAKKDVKPFLLRLDPRVHAAVQRWAEEDLRSLNGQIEYILRQEEIDRVVLTGQVTEQCILYSALDAYVRHFGVVVPRDACAPIHDDLAEAALRMMQINMSAEVVDAGSVRLSDRG